MNYPSAQADSLERYVRKSFSLSAVARHIYAAIRWLEQAKGVGLCKVVFAGYREVADEAAVDVKSVRRGLQELQMSSLIRVVIGSRIKSDRKATSIRRFTLEEIKQQSIQGDDIASRLAVALGKQPIRFGGQVIQPMWTTSHTGRVISSKPNIQGKSPDEREKGLSVGLEHDEVLVHADIKRAEPSVIMHLLRVPLDRDHYQELMEASDVSRDDAKSKLSALAYCRDSMAFFGHWSPKAKVALMDYAEKLADYKKQLFAKAKVDRYTTTMSGRKIVAGKRCRPHSGKWLNWRVQGTVADIVNSACFRLLGSARTIVPVHDAIYAVLQRDQVHLVKDVIVEEAQKLGLKMTVVAKSYSLPLAVPKTTTSGIRNPSVELYPKPPLITTGLAVPSSSTSSFLSLPCAVPELNR